MVAYGDSMWHDEVIIHHPSMSAVDVRSTDDDVAPIDLPYLTATLTVNIFQSVTPFDETFTPLENLRRSLNDHVISMDFWEL
jgi:hypothetical protein